MAVKKASFVLSKTMLLILSVIFLIVLIVAFLNPVGKVLNKAGEKSCNSFFKTKKFFDFFNVKIPYSVTKKFCPPTFIYVKTNDEEKIKETIADSMINCWNNYGRGSSEIFQNKGSNYYCVLCSSIQFENKDSETKNDNSKTIIKMSDLYNYLKNNYVPYSQYNDLTYLEFLSNCDLNGCYVKNFYIFNPNEEMNNELKTSLSNYDYDISTDKDYAILYFIYENNAIINKLDALKASAGAGVVSAILLFFAPVSTPILLVGAVGTFVSVGASAVTFKIASKSPEWSAGVTIVPYDPEFLKENLKCENIENI